LPGREAARGRRLTFNQLEIMSQDRSSGQKLATCALAMAVLSGGRSIDERVDPTVASLLAAHNRERKKEGRDPLTLSSKLCESAAVHALDMAKHQKLDHAGSDGSTVADRIKRTGYVFVRVGENIAVGQETVDEVMNTWMKSPGHRANILAEFIEMGAARAEDDQGDPYWCVNFGIPMPRLKAEEAVAAVVKQINRDRQAAGQVVLKAEPRLGRAAMAISEAMAAKDSLEFDGDPFKLIDEKAIEGREVRLQLSANVPTPAEAAKALLGEDAGKLAAFREIGVGYALAKNGTPYLCAIFTKPAGVKPPVVPE
jgi:uncharacterized protein YkwD